MKILDAGCGGGRNLVYFLRNNYDVFAVDQNNGAIESVRQLSARLAPLLPASNFQAAPVENLPFPDEHFDAVLSSAVLHFARDEKHFQEMLNEMWRVLKIEGVLFARLASTIGIESRVELIEGRRFLLPDSSERFLVDENFIAAATKDFSFIWEEPLKTTNVQNLRCMTTIVLRKTRI